MTPPHPAERPSLSPAVCPCAFSFVAQMSSKGNELLALLDEEMDEANQEIGAAERPLGKTELKSDDDEGDDDDDANSVGAGAAA